MRASPLVLNALACGLVITLLAKAEARDCSMGYFKTYIPKFAGLENCDEHGVPAQFVGDWSGIMKALGNKGYRPEKHDQCSRGSDNPQALALITQVGDCEGRGENEVICQLYLAVIENGSNKVLFEKTYKNVESSNFPSMLSTAVGSVPSCSSL